MKRSCLRNHTIDIKFFKDQRGVILRLKISFYFTCCKISNKSLKIKETKIYNCINSNIF